MAKTKKHGRHLTHAEAVRYGKMGGSPVLLSLKLHRPVRGYKVTRVKNGKDRD